MARGGNLKPKIALIEKLCPVLLRPAAAGPELLVFRHPLAGTQLVKGTREQGESIADGALRELAEEAGIVDATVIGSLGSSSEVVADHLWHFLAIDCPLLPDQWIFDTADGGGLRFSFSWWPLDKAPDTEWHPIFVRGLRHIRAALGRA